MTRKALIVVDVQKDFTEGGSLAVEGGKATAEKIDKLLRTPDHGYDFVVATLDYHHRLGDNGGHFAEEPDYVDTWPVHCVQGTEGSGFEAPLEAQMFLEVFTKGDGEPAYSGFQGTGQVTGQDLDAFLASRNVTEVDIVGIAYDYCVKATALDAAGTGLTTRVLMDYTVPVSQDNVAAVDAQLSEAKVQLVA